MDFNSVNTHLLLRRAVGESVWSLTSADGNTLPAAEEPGVKLFGETDVGRCWSPAESQRNNKLSEKIIHANKRRMCRNQLTIAFCWSSTNVWVLKHLLQKNMWASVCALKLKVWGLRLSVCAYPRYVGRPCRTGDWTEWWGACLRVSGRWGLIKPPGYGPLSSSCTLDRRGDAEMKNLLGWNAHAKCECWCIS